MRTLTQSPCKWTAIKGVDGTRKKGTHTLTCFFYLERTILFSDQVTMELLVIICQANQKIFQIFQINFSLGWSITSLITASSFKYRTRPRLSRLYCLVSHRDRYLAFLFSTYMLLIFKSTLPVRGRYNFLRSLKDKELS